MGGSYARILLAASLMACATATAQLDSSWSGAGIKLPERKPTVVELESVNLAEFRKALPAGMPDFALEYWQRRMDLAIDLDAKRISPDAWVNARQAQDALFQARIDAEGAKLKAQADAQMQADRTQQAADYAARERQKSQMMFDMGMRLLQPQVPRPMVRCDTNRFGQTVCW